MFNNKMGSKIDEITTGFHEILEQKRNLELIVNPSRPSSRTRERQTTPTTSVPESHVYGREKETAAILELVLGSEANDDHGVVVIPIVGVGGVGKTTIVRLVYNDDRVKGYFDLKAWVCVSQEFDVIWVTKAILESFSSRTPDVSTLNSLQERLVEKLSKKKFLLVLDDVWLENYDEWTNLLKPLKAGAPGSKIIVTTRNEGVSSLMGTIPSSYHLKDLSYNDCLDVFTHHAMVDFDVHPSLRQTCEEIVKRCTGLPLAAKALGGLLRTKVNLDEWKAVLNSAFWDFPEGKCNVLPVLRLSYHHLLPHLKRCFAFCSIFPKDYEFGEEELVWLWMAVGLVVKQYSKERQMEDIGGGYFRDLFSRSFFQRSSSNEELYVMHDLVNDLAQWVAGETTFRLEEKQNKISTKALHSSYIGSRYDGVKKFDAFYGLKRLRTFLPLMTPNSSFLTNNVTLNLLQEFKCLRVLSLNNYWITDLPNSIGDLKHLRYIDLSFTKIRSLPESTSTLYNLLTLILKGCFRLKKLPTKMQNLINLRHLDITGADSVKEMPPGVGNLMNLQRLSNFIVGNNGRTGIVELMRLNYLQRTLCISRLENVVNARDAREARLKDKHDLDELTLQWSSEFNDSRNEGVENEVLDMLQPHKKLKKLTIKCYGGLSFSNWIGHSSFSNMVFLRLEDSGKCIFLPPVGQLPLLKDLFIKGMKKVYSMGTEFCGVSSEKPFQSLETLTFEDMEEWEHWFPCGVDRQVEVFSRLRKLSIVRSHKLLGKLPDHLPLLEKLNIEGCQQLSVQISSLPKLCELRIKGCHEVVQSSLISLVSVKVVVLSDISKLTCLTEEGFVQGLTKVKDLEISGCKELMCLWKTGVGLQHLISICHLRIKESTELVSLLAEETEEVACRLESLELIGCGKLEKLQGLHRLAALKELTIENCQRLVYFPETGLPSMLRELTIRHCHSLISLTRGQLPSMLKKLKIRNCKNLQRLLDEGDDSTTSCLAIQKSNNYGTTSLLEHLEIYECRSLMSISSKGGELPSTLKKLVIWSCEKLEAVAEKFHINSSLESIWIQTCKSLTSLPKGLDNLSHLCEFLLWSCPNLVFFSDGLVLPSTNLRELWITDCEKLEALPNSMHNLISLQELRIGICPGMVSFPEQGFPTNLTLLYMSNVKINKLVLQWGLHRLTSLKELLIEGGFPDLISFPGEEEDGMMLPTSLIRLIIGNFPNLEYLSFKGFENLTSLEVLYINNCPKLKCFPKKGLPPSLLELSISRSPLLEERCKKDKGRDWPKIAHLPYVSINSRLIHNQEEE